MHSIEQSPILQDMSSIGVFRDLPHEKEKSNLSFFFLAAGLFFQICTTAISLQKKGNLDLLFLIVFGSLLCFSLRLRGLLYSLLILCCGALFKHLFFLDHHLWRLGLETSTALGWLSLAMTSELLYLQNEGLATQVASQEQTVRNLEEELTRTRKEAQEERITLQDRLALLQNEFDELSKDVSALQILNDVLRKTNAKMSCEQEALLTEREQKNAHFIEFTEQKSDLEAQIAELQKEFSLSKEEYKKLQENYSQLEEERLSLKSSFERLQSDLSEFAFSQTALAELKQEYDLLQEQNNRLSQEQALLYEKEKDLEINYTQLVEDYSVLKKEHAQLIAQQPQIEILKQEQTYLFELRKDYEHLQTLLAEQERVCAHLERRNQELVNVQLLYQQLKKQFEEKGQVLHQTRRKLFALETQLQGMCLDQEHKARESSSSSLEKDLSFVEHERLCLEEENHELTDLVTHLSRSEIPTRQRKKREQKSEEHLLF